MQITKKPDYIQELVKQAKTILIISAGRGDDVFASAVALSEYLESVSESAVSVIYAGEAESINQSLADLMPVNTELQASSLKITIDYADTEINSVDYHKEGDSKLILEMKPVIKGFDLKKIKYDFEGSDFDLIFTLGVDSFESLGELYSRNESVFEKAKIINIDNQTFNKNFGKINLVHNAESMCALMMGKFGEWGYIPGKRAATALLIGLYS